MTAKKKVLNPETVLQALVKKKKRPHLNNGKTVENAGWKNLKHIKPGQILNPKGRGAAGTSVSEYLKIIGKMECKLPTTVARFGRGLTFNQVIALAAEHAAAAGDRYARDFVTLRTEGSVPQTILTDPPVELFLTDEEKVLILDMLEKHDSIKGGA